MSANNKISAEITAAQLQAVITGIADLKNSLSSILKFNLTADDRATMLKMGDKTLAFVGKSLNYAQQNPNLMPSYFDLAEAQKDYKLATDLYQIYQLISALLRSVEDSNMVAGSEAYEAALVFYNSVKGASRSNIAGAQAIFDDLKQQFPRNKVNKTTNNL